MRKLLVNIWRAFQKSKLNKKGVKLKGIVYFNQNTLFGGYNRVSYNSIVSNSVIGRFSYIGKNDQLDNVEIGKFCSIGSDLKVVTATHPSKDFVSTHPAFYSAQSRLVKSFAEEDIFVEHLSVNGRNLIIGNDVWIGHDVRFIGGITVGDGAIIGTGALVTKDVPPYAIVGGVPAKIIRYRFNEEQIAFLLRFKWWDKDDEWLKEHVKEFSSIENFVQLENH